jgi:hypothetical protein
MPFSAQRSNAGVVGLCSVGRTLALRLAATGVRVSLLDDSAANVEEFVAQNTGTRGGLVGYTSCEDFVESLNTPRRVVVFETRQDRLAVVLRLSWQEPNRLLEYLLHDETISSGDLEQLEMALRCQLG